MRLVFSKYWLRWLLGLAIVTTACLQSQFMLAVVNRIDNFIYDMQVKLEPAHSDPRIVIVDIDEKSINEMGWPWSRNVYADLVDKLCDRYHARAVGFDIVFSEPDPNSGYRTIESLARHEFKDVPVIADRLPALKEKLDFDAQFAKAMTGKPVVLGYVLDNGTNFSKGKLPQPAFTVADLGEWTLDALPSEHYTADLDELEHAAMASGFVTPHLDDDGIIRHVLMMARIGDAYYESLALATARVALGATKVRPVFIDKNYGDVEKLELDTFPRPKNVAVESALTALIRYRGPGGPKGGTFRYISAADVINGRIPQSEIDGTIVLVGTTALGLHDLRAAPVSNDYPGVEMHANVIASILDGDVKQRPDYSATFEFVEALLIGLMLTVLLPMLSPARSIALVSGTGFAAILLNVWMYRSMGQVLPLATTLLLILSLFIFNIAWGYLFEYRKSCAMVNLFGEYVAPELVAQMAERPDSYTMEGESRMLTVMFSDVRGFTTISEALEPNVLREYINLYLTAMSEDIQGNRGTLDKYIGDAVMAFWGAPVELPDHASLAVASALKMQETAKKLNEDFVSRGWPPLKIGIGLNTGEMRVGDMGSKVRRAYTVMGDAVNLASRLEGITKTYGADVVVGEATMRAAPEFFYRELDWVRVKGKNEPVAIFEPLGRTADIDAGTRATIERWHAVLAFFRTQKWDEAESGLKALQENDPENVLYSLFLENIAHYRENPPGENWDGVATFTTK